MLHFGVGLLVHLSYDTIVLNTQNRRFHVLQPIFLFPMETPVRL